MTRVAVKVGDQVFAREGAVAFGAVRQVHSHELIIFIEGEGDAAIAASTVKAVHDGKVIVDITSLSPELRKAIAAAHTREEPGT